MDSSDFTEQDDGQQTGVRRADVRLKDKGDLHDALELVEDHHRPLRGSTGLRASSLYLGVLKSPMTLWGIILLQFLAIALLLLRRTPSPQPAYLYFPHSKELSERWEDLYNFGISRIPKS
ncbi:hypothetical protein EYR38_001955 [Pleurotus pulmonarius]|nr:hypothetical protein EYR38_001955 [Pleurotus pulmonarius]